MKTIQELADIGAKATQRTSLAPCDAFTQAVADEVAKDYQERLAQLEWRLVSVKPTKDDADSDGYVSVLDEAGELSIWRYDFDFSRRATHWRPASPPPQQVDAEFESWWGVNAPILTCSKDEALKIWKSAREAK